jgi:3-oxoadipate enol-lactonase
MPDLNLSPNLTLHYLEYHPGGAQTVLLLHGLGATGASWEFQFQPLVDAGFHILAPDTRGFGASSYPGKTSVAEMAGDMAALLERLGVPSCHVVGISMGGTLALQLAVDHPGLVKKLVLVNTFASLRPKKISVWLYFILRFTLVHTLGLPAQAQAVAKRIFPKAEQEELRLALISQILQADPRGYRATMRALGLFDIRRKLSEIRASTLVITSGSDTTVPPKTQKVLSDKIPQALTKLIPDAGHAVIVEKPHIFNQILLDFLTNPTI